MPTFALEKTKNMKKILISKLQSIEDTLIIISIATALFYLKGPWGTVLGLGFLLYNFWFIFWEQKNPQPRMDFMEKDNLPALIGFVLAPIAALFFLEDKSRDMTIPFIVESFFFGLVSIAIWYLKSDFTGKSTLRIISDSLHLSPIVNLFLIFFCVCDLDPITLTSDIWRYALAAVFILDLGRGLFRLPGDIDEMKTEYDDFYKSLEEEKEELDEAATKVDGIDEGIRNLLNDRISLIDKILISRMSESSISKKDLAKEIDKVISDREAFIRSLGLLYSVNHSKAIKQLKDDDLTEEEIGLCCLYYLGYSGKEVKDIYKSSMVYHMNSAIRQKIGLKSTDMNLTTYMRQLFEN